ncbi:hypothetical protein FOA43_001983 [Brettanomyces nanus]|uniref:Inositolphosphotransferase Aur1/Ipt1 domain-containing protein n=1 Tax=Eeniella nana TaxID=13502 RepID=A0A875RYP2_EENNA|nr:uncharacterized protein FOA43_001983 [Brettanomyces nanus]QPG74651.1 hypothetical protein FOA43_001983 [Brettanomyces nanus]
MSHNTLSKTGYVLVAPFWLIWRIIVSGLNRRNLFGLAFNFFTNFSPVMIWLFIFQHASLIPKSIRPQIHSKVAFLMDQYLFGDWFGELEKQAHPLHPQIATLTSVVFGSFLIMIPLSIWYYIYYIRKINYNIFNWYDYLFHYKFEYINCTYKFRPTRLRVIIPFLLPLMASIALNIDYLFASQDPANFTKTKDIIAWLCYVVLHVTVPILTAIYLYAFRPPGTLKCFGFAIGLQNIVAVFTHLLIPMAPPWFTHMYGLNDTEHVNYNQEGYAAGLTRVDSHLGTHLNTNGFHQSPIVFGSVPSIHSAVAFQCFLFLEFQSCSSYHFCKKWASTLGQSTAISDDCEEALISKKPIHLLNLIKSASSSSDSNDCSTGASSSSNPSSSDSSDTWVNSSDSDPSADPSCEDLTFSNYPDQIDEVDEVDDDNEDDDYDTSLEMPFTKELLSPVKHSYSWLQGHLYTASEPSGWAIWKLLTHSAIISRFIGASFLMVQWWATMYLDHHFRFDLFVGMLYAMVSYCIVDWLILQPRVMFNWCQIRLKNVDDKNNEAKTMGMRVFENQSFKWFFDPFA